MKIAIADSHVLFRSLLEAALTAHGHDVLFAVGDATEFLMRLEKVHPDVAVIDVALSPHSHNVNGIGLVMQIREKHPKIGIAVLSQYLDSSVLEILLGIGPHGVGYLLKEQVTDVGTLEAALHQIANGGVVIDPQVVAAAMSRARHSTSATLKTLTAREREVLRLIAEGQSNSAIAQTIASSQKTVETHVRSIFAKLNLTDDHANSRRVLAALTYLRAVGEIQSHDHPTS